MARKRKPAPTEIGARVREARRAKGWSSKRLAQEAGVPSTSLWRVENGEGEPKPEMLAKLAVALGVTDRYLLTGSDAPAEAGDLFDAESPTLRIHGRPMDRSMIQVYPETAVAVRALARKHGLSAAELMEQLLAFCMAHMAKD